MKKKRVNNKSSGRSYIYDQAYENTPLHIKQREERNLARKEMLQHYTSKYGAAKAKQMLKGFDVDHTKSLNGGGSNKKSNRRLRKVSSNRGDKTY